MIACKILNLLIIVLIGSIVLQSVSGIDVSPAESRLTLIAGESLNGSFSLIDYESGISYSLVPGGRLREYIILERNVANPSSGDGTVRFWLNVSESGMKIHGDISGAIYVFRNEPDGSTGGISSAIHYVNLWHPYAGYHILPALSVVQREGYIDFIVNVSNVGTDDISRAWVEITLFDEEKMASITMKRPAGPDSAAVLSNSRSIISSDVRRLALPNIEESIPAGVSKVMIVSASKGLLPLAPGNYGIQALVAFDGNFASDDMRTDIGRHEVRAANITSEFVTGAVEKMHVQVFNDWNLPVRDVSVSVDVIDHQGKSVGVIDSFPFHMDPRSYKEVVVFFNTAGVMPGPYRAVVHVMYSNDTFTNEFAIGVNSDDFAGAPGAHINDEDAGAGSLAFHIMLWAMALLVLAVIGEIVYIFYRNCRHKSIVTRRARRR